MATNSEPTVEELLRFSDEEPAPARTWNEMLADDPGLRQEWECQDWASKLKIEYLVTQYLRANPSYVYPPSGDTHPSVLAIGTKLQGWLMDALGGVKEYWIVMFAAAQVWFADLESEPHLAREFNIFCQFFDMPGCLGYEGDSEYKALYAECLAWRRQRSKFRDMYDPNAAIT